MAPFLTGKKVLVTGGSGYIGKHVVRAFRQFGADVEVWDIVDHPANYAVSYHEIDITNAHQIIELDRQRPVKFDVVCNLAAVANVPDCEKDPGRAWATNHFGALNVMELALRKWDCLFIQADSAMSPFATYAGVYAKTKAATKRSVEAHRALGWNAVCLSLYNVAGAGDHRLDPPLGEDHEPETHFIPNVVLSYTNGTTLKLDRNPRIRRDFVHVSDVAIAFTQVAKRHFGGTLEVRDYEVGRGEEVALLHVVKQAWDLGWKFPIEEVDSGRWEPYNEMPDLKFCANSANFVPGWSPNFNVSDMLLSQYAFQLNRLPK